MDYRNNTNGGGPHLGRVKRGQESKQPQMHRKTDAKPDLNWGKRSAQPLKTELEKRDLSSLLSRRSASSPSTI